MTERIAALAALALMVGGYIALTIAVEAIGDLIEWVRRLWK